MSRKPEVTEILNSPVQLSILQHLALKHSKGGRTKKEDLLNSFPTAAQVLASQALEELLHKGLIVKAPKGEVLLNPAFAKEMLEIIRYRNELVHGLNSANSPLSDANEKQKLTLGISKYIVEKAKLSGINISAITEQILSAMTYEPIGSSRDDVIQAYTAFFEVARGILQRYGASVTVGDYEDSEGGREHWSIVLTGTGLWKEPASAPEYSMHAEVGEVVFCLYKPTRILEKLIVALIDAAEENKQKLAELEFALRFVKSLADDKEKSRK